MLVDDGAVLVKLWFHLAKKTQKKRLVALEKDKLTRWRVTPQDWKNFARYNAFRSVSEHVLRETSTGAAPWLVIDGSNANYRALVVGRALLAAIQARLGAAREAAKLNGKANRKKNGASASPPAAVSMLRTLDTAGILKNLPFEERLSKHEDYEAKVVKAQAKLGKRSVEDRRR